MKKELEIFDPFKTAAIWCLTKTRLSIKKLESDSRKCVFVFSGEAKFHEALESYFTDTPIPVKSFSDTYRLLSAEMFHVLGNGENK